MTDTPRRPITVEDLLELRPITEAALSPDGRLALYVTGKVYDEKDKPASRTIMAVSTDGGEPWPYSAGEAADTMPRWSPDGATLAFLSDRPHDLPEEAHAAKKQVYLLARSGGEARRLTAVRGEIQDLAWSPDGARLALLMSEPETDEQRKRHEERGEAIDVEQEPRFWRLWSVSTLLGESRSDAPRHDETPGTETSAAGAAEPVALTPTGVQVWDFALAPDGRSAALIASDLPFEWSWYQSRLAVAALDGSAPATIYTTPRQLAYPRFAPDGATVAVLSCTWSDRGYYGGDVLLLPASGGTVQNLTEGRPISVLWAEWEPDGAALLCCGCEEGDAAIWRLGRDGELRTLWRAEEAIGGSPTRFYRAGETLVLPRMNPTAPSDLWLARLDGETLGGWRRLTRLNPQVDEWALGPVRTVHWRAHDGTPIQGLLALPPGDAEGTASEALPAALPLVTLVHGGPAGIRTHSFALELWARLLCAAGIAVFMPNPRGSTGWGTAFTEANLGDMGNRDLGDILGGIDHLIDLGVADADRLGIGGWSYGGFMTAWAITQVDCFKAAVMGAGIADWRSFHGVSNISTWDALFYGTLGRPADPYDPDGPYERFTALAHLDRVTTPTLILHGERDECVPVGQGYQMLRALRDRGVTAEMTVYPRAGHGPRERAHQKDMQERGVAWFRRYLGVE